MTFLTEAFGVHGKHKRALSIPFVHAPCQCLSTTVGLLFPRCPSKQVWYTLLALSCSLFSVILHRLHSKQQAFFGMKPDLSRGHVVRSRSIVAQNAQGVYHLLDSLSRGIFTSRFILPALVPDPASLWRNPAIPMVMEAILDYPNCCK